MPDLQETESVENLSKRERDQLLDYDRYVSINEMLKNQYIEFEDLGTNLLSDIEDKQILNAVLTDFTDYFHNNISPIVEYQKSQIDGNTDQLGLKVYKFLCVDCYLTIIPKFLEELKIYSINDFERYYYETLDATPSSFKANFVRSIRDLYNNIKKLEKLDKTIKNDGNYKDLIRKYEFYIELMNFGNIDNFLNNYFRPVLSKNENDITWRIN